MLELRGETYGAGEAYERALREAADALMGGRTLATELAVSRLNEAAHVYGSALTKLSDHLSKLEQTEFITTEAKRARKEIALLDEQVELTLQRLAAL